MANYHGKKKDDEKNNKIKKPLKKPEVIDKLKTQSTKTTVSDSQKRKQVAESSKKTTVTDTQKRGQTGLRYDLYDGIKRPLKEPTKKSSQQPTKKQPTKFLPHVIKPLYILKGKKSKNKSGVMV